MTMVDFESDPRFISLCQQLNTPQKKTIPKGNENLTSLNDLSTVLGVTGEDEAAKLVSNITVPQMIKVS